VKGIEAAFPGSMWQQCQTNFMRRALDLAREVGKATLCEDLRMILQACSRERAEEERALLEEHWGKRFPKPVAYLEEHFDSVLATGRPPGRASERPTTSSGSTRN